MADPGYYVERGTYGITRDADGLGEGHLVDGPFKTGLEAAECLETWPHMSNGWTAITCVTKSGKRKRIVITHYSIVDPVRVVVNDQKELDRARRRNGIA